MKKPHIGIPCSIILFCLLACNNRKEQKAFDDILQSKPFAAITDSIRRDPGNDELYFRRGVSLNANDLAAPALADFRKAWSLRKDEKYAFGLGNLLLEERPDSALLFLRDALTELPNSFLLKLTLARTLMAQRKQDEALALAEQLIDAHPNQVDVLKMKADILREKGNKTEAVNTLMKAYQLTPEDVELNYMLALNMAENKNAQVLLLCDSLIAADSLGIHAEPFYYKGVYYSSTGDKLKAISFFDQAVKRDYYFLDGYIEKAATLYELKKYKEAITVLNLCLTLSAKFADTYYWIAKYQQALNQKDEARINCQRAFSLDQSMTAARDSAERLK